MRRDPSHDPRAGTYTEPFPNKVSRARDLRRQATPAERALWQLLRKRALGTKFRRQHVAFGFIIDFYCPEFGLVIELDGGVHRAQEAEDLARERALLAHGIVVVRLRNADVLEAPGRVLTHLQAVLEPLRSRAHRTPAARTPPSPAASRERGRG